MPSFEAIKNRKVIQWSLAYAAGAFALLQALEFAASTYHWPVALMRIAPILLVGGLLLTIVFAWFHGDKGRQRITPLEALLIAAVVLATTTFAILLGRNSDSPVTAGNDVVSEQSVAVLPFENISTDNESAYFANGIHDELLTQLAQLGGLDVISRTSVSAYRNTTKSIRQIAKELGVAAVLEGSVQKAGSRVRVQAQLINGATDKHLWAERYDRELTDVFAIQSDIAQQISTALKAELTKGEKQKLEKQPTKSTEAYDAYLRARMYLTLPGMSPPNLESAIKQFERAIALDPTFALAHAWLAYAQGTYYWFGYDASTARIAISKREAELALRYDANLPEAHLAMGNYYYWALRDYARAIAEYEIARKLAPGNSEVLNQLGAVSRRMGRFEEGLAYFKQVAKLNPLDVQLWSDGLAQTYEVLHHWSDARAAYRKALEFAPDMYDSKSEMGWNYVYAEGQLDSLRAYLRDAPTDERYYESPAYDRFRLAYYSRDFKQALRIAQAAPELIQNQERYIPRGLMVGWASGSRAAFDSARVVAEAAVRKNPDDPRLHLAVAFALAGLGRNAEAIKAADHARNLLPLSKDAMVGYIVAQEAASVYALAGAKDKAIELTAQLLKLPGRLTVHELRLNPRYDALRSDPRFMK